MFVLQEHLILTSGFYQVFLDEDLFLFKTSFIIAIKLSLDEKRFKKGNLHFLIIFLLG